jgi:adenosylcobinamide-GDP ribazoletransferase
VTDPGRVEPARLGAGLRLALTTFTVLPVGRRPRAAPDRAAAALAMSAAPLVGALLGLVEAGAALGLRALAAPPLVLGAVVVGLDALLTRGLHLDGLADTVDGLGSYAGRERALQIMRGPEVGPFGVAALALTLLTQAAAVGALAGRSWPALLSGVVAAAATGRLSVAWACRPGVPAARPDGLGALVAGTVGWPARVVGTLAVAAAALPALPGRLWQGPLAVVLALGTGLVLTRHAVRRLGGITGDVLGALVELSATVTLLVLVLG